MKTIKYLTILATALISIGLISCSPVAYSTTGQNVPLFKEKGECRLSAEYASASNSYDYAEGLGVQAAVAVDKHVGIISSFYVMNQETEDWSGEGNYFDVGAGVFKSTRNKKITGEIFVGAGFGTIRNTSVDSYFNIKFNKYFVQPSLGFTLEHFEVAVTPRIGIVNFKSQTNGDYSPSLKTTVVFEPGVTLRAGFKYLKFQYQSNVSTFTLSESDTFTTYNFYTSLGVSFLISKRWAEK